jgi:hypothetical protein
MPIRDRMKEDPVAGSSIDYEAVTSDSFRLSASNFLPA